MAVVGRLQLNHPALGTTGGAGLHAAVEGLYEKIGDNMVGRFFEILDFDAAQTVDLDHNYNVDLEDIRYDIYYLDGGQLVRLDETTTPLRSEFSLVEKTGSEKTVLEITNNSATSNLTVYVVLLNDPIYLSEDDISDIDITTVAPEDGQALVFDSATDKFKPGASGDSSFKLQSVSDPNATIKGGYLIDNDGREYATYDGVSVYGGDLTVSLDTILGGNPANDTSYYLYIDRDLVGAQATETSTGRKLYQVTESELALLTNSPDLVDLTRYIPIGLVHSADAGTVWSGTGAAFRDLARRSHTGIPFERYENEFTTAPGATIAHGLGKIPTVVSVLHNELADGRYAVLNPENFIKVDATNIYTSGFGALTIDGTHQLKIIALAI